MMTYVPKSGRIWKRNTDGEDQLYKEVATDAYIKMDLRPDRLLSLLATVENVVAVEYSVIQ